MPPLRCVRRPRRGFPDGNHLNWNSLNGNHLNTGQSIGSQIVAGRFDGVRISDNRLDSTSLSGAVFIGHHIGVEETPQCNAPIRVPFGGKGLPPTTSTGVAEAPSPAR
jgi:hypothetical protein